MLRKLKKTIIESKSTSIIFEDVTDDIIDNSINVEDVDEIKSEIKPKIFSEYQKELDVLKPTPIKLCEKRERPRTAAGNIERSKILNKRKCMNKDNMLDEFLKYLYSLDPFVNQQNLNLTLLKNYLMNEKRINRSNLETIINFESAIIRGAEKKGQKLEFI
jgi:hypothetical protein